MNVSRYDRFIAMDHITNPHDKFFKEVFTRRSAVTQWLEHYLPPEIAGLLDLSSLEFIKDSFVDKHLSEYFSDLLLKTYLKDGSWGYVYILFEHKSYQEPLTAFHLLRYMVKIWETAFKKKEDLGFPVIIPLVLYHGESTWRAKLNFRDLLRFPEQLNPFVPDFQYILWDASQYTDEEIKGEAVLRVALLILKYIFKDDLKDRLAGILELLKELSERQTGMEYLATVLKYIVNAAPEGHISYEDLKAAVNQALPHQGGEILPTIAESLKEQGMQQGIQQGILQDAREALIDILEVRFEVIPPAMMKILNDINDPAILKILRRKAVKVKSLDEFGRGIDFIME